MKKAYCGFLMLLCLALSACFEKKEPRTTSFFLKNEKIAREILAQCEKDKKKVIEGECENAKYAVDRINFADAPPIEIR